MSQFYAVHAYDLKPEVNRNEFERFMQERWLPYVMRKKGCRGTMLLKGYTGEWRLEKKEYATIEIWESAKANRAAWGGPRSQWVTPEDMRDFMEQFTSYVIPQSFRTYEFERIV